MQKRDTFEPGLGNTTPNRMNAVEAEALLLRQEAGL